ncbi:MAG: T9SS type A sorting domain-containing protein, partial [Bacteroidota bacterium]
EAEDLEDTENKAILTTIANASGNYPQVTWPEGDLELRNLWIVSGERLPGDNHGWGQIRIIGDKVRVNVTDCRIEKDRGGFIQVRGDSTKIYITNCELRNGGNRRLLQGNGRAFDARDAIIDTLVMRQTVVYNLADRFFRSQGGKGPHNYIEIDNCTAFNVAGRHGFIQLGQVYTAKITDNLFINPIMLGTSPIYTDEQTQPDNGQHKVITMDTLFDSEGARTQLTISNNNIFWDQSVTDYWATNDTVSAPPVLSDLVMQNLGDAASDAFFSDPLTLENVPVSILQYVQDLYADPTSTDMFDFIVEDSVLLGSDFDFGNLFNFANFSPCYDPGSTSATASLTGGPVGATFLCANLATSVFTPDVNNTLALTVFPNPVTQRTNFQFELKKAGQVQLNIRDMSGRVIATPIRERLTEGQHVQSWQIPSTLPRGLYMVTLATEEGIMTQKLMVQ